MASIDIGFFFWWNTTNPKNTSWHLSGFQPDRSLMWNTGQNAIEIIHRVMMGNANPEVQDLNLLSWLPILKYPKVTICYWHGRKFAPAFHMSSCEAIARSCAATKPAPLAIPLGFSATMAPFCLGKWSHDVPWLMIADDVIWLFNSLPWKITIFNR